MISHDALFGAPITQLRRAASAGIVSDLLPNFNGFRAAGQPAAAQSPPAASHG